MRRKVLTKWKRKRRKGSGKRKDAEEKKQSSLYD